MSAASIYLGIDPGKTGALAFFRPGKDELTIFDVPLFELSKSSGAKKRVVDLIQLATIIDNEVRDRTVVVFIELVGSRPGEANSASFDFGFTTGALNGLCAAHFLRIEHVAPSVWKRVLKVPADKDGARAVASKLMPRHANKWPRKMDDGRAEAALIALYGARVDGAL